MKVKRIISPSFLLTMLLIMPPGVAQAAPPDNGSLAKTTSTPVAFTGGIASYNIDVSNLGNNTIPNVVVSDTLPAGFTYVAGTTTINGVPAADPLGTPDLPVWDIGNIAGNNTVTLSFDALVDATTPPGVYYNSVTATGRNGNYTFPAAGPTAAVTVQIGAPSLTVLKSASAPSANPGGSVTYTVMVQNTGTAPGDNILAVHALGGANKLALDPFGTGSPVRLIEGANPSGLALGAITYSNNNGVSYAYTPVDDGTGHDPDITNFRVQMIGTIPANQVVNPYFSLQYEARIE